MIARGPRFYVLQRPIWCSVLEQILCQEKRCEQPSERAHSGATATSATAAASQCMRLSDTDAVTAVQPSRLAPSLGIRHNTRYRSPTSKLLLSVPSASLQARPEPASHAQHHTAVALGTLCRRPEAVVDPVSTRNGEGEGHRVPSCGS